MTKNEELTILVIDRKRFIEELTIVKAIDCNTIVGFAVKTSTTIYGKKMPNLALGLIRDSYNTAIDIYNDRIDTITKQINTLLNP